MRILIILFVSHVVAMIFHTSGLFLAGRLAGATISEVGIFTGPEIMKIEVYGLPFRLNLFPLGSYIKFDADQSPARGKRLDEINPLIRALIAASGCIALLALAAISLGPRATLHQTVTGFSQIVSGGLSPIANGTRLLQRLWQFAATEPLLATVGLVASKEAAFNLLPLPVFNGGDIILNLVTLVKPISSSLRDKLNIVGLLLMIVIWISWLAALIWFLVSART